MELLIIEILLWIGFGFLLWAMHESLMQIEEEVEGRTPRFTVGPLSQEVLYRQPQLLIDPIGQYRGQTIHDYAIIDGRRYRFDHVCQQAGARRLPGGQRWVAPGLVYVECAAPVIATSGV